MTKIAGLKNTYSPESIHLSPPAPRLLVEAIQNTHKIDYKTK